MDTDETGSIPSQRQRMIRWLVTLVIVLSGILLVSLGGLAAKNGRPLPEITAPVMPPAETVMIGDSWLRLNNLPENASQVDAGAEIYRLVCSTCHGDRGQGLTPDWLATWNPKDRNCWQSKCHASNHPPDGFVLPSTVPAITGPDFTGHFQNALELQAFIQARMPYHAPGSLQPDEYWQVTAYVLLLNGFELGDQLLDPITAAAILIK